MKNVSYFKGQIKKKKKKNILKCCLPKWTKRKKNKDFFFFPGKTIFHVHELQQIRRNERSIQTHDEWKEEVKKSQMMTTETVMVLQFINWDLSGPFSGPKTNRKESSRTICYNLCSLCSLYLFTVFLRSRENIFDFLLKVRSDNLHGICQICSTICAICNFGMIARIVLFDYESMSTALLKLRS